MSSLQLWLLVLGLAVLVALLAQAVWAARRSELRRAPGERTGERGGTQREPVLGPLPASAAESDAGGEGAQGHAEAGTSDPLGSVRPSEGRAPSRADDSRSAAAIDTGPPLRLEPVLARRSSARLDALIDAIATVRTDAPVTGETALAHLPPTRRAGTKPLSIEGLDADTGDWEAPQAGVRYREFQAGVQLANRSGALNEIEYSEFVHKVQAFADSLGAMPDFPDMLDVVARARELDAFASEHDAQLAVRLVSRGPAWSPGYVQQQAARHGFVPGALPGRLAFSAAEEGSPPVLTLQFDAQAAMAEEPGNAAVRELTLAFDVPQTASSKRPFAAWCAAAEGLSAALDAALYDDGGQPLRPAAFESIGSELERLYAALEARDLAAGSASARRLFS